MSNIWPPKEKEKNGSSHLKKTFGLSASKIRSNLLSFNTWKMNCKEVVQSMALNGTLEKLSNFSKNSHKFRLVKSEKNLNIPGIEH